MLGGAAQLMGGGQGVARHGSGYRHFCRVPGAQQIGVLGQHHQAGGVIRQDRFQVEIRVHVATGEQPAEVAVAAIIFHQTHGPLPAAGLGDFRPHNGA